MYLDNYKDLSLNRKYQSCKHGFVSKRPTLIPANINEFTVVDSGLFLDVPV